MFATKNSQGHCWRFTGGPESALVLSSFSPIFYSQIKIKASPDMNNLLLAMNSGSPGLSIGCCWYIRSSFNCRFRCYRAPLICFSSTALRYLHWHDSAGGRMTWTDFWEVFWEAGSGNRSCAWRTRLQLEPWKEGLCCWLLAPSGALIAIPAYYWPSTSTTHFFRSHRSGPQHWTYTFWATTAI